MNFVKVKPQNVVRTCAVQIEKQKPSVEALYLADERGWQKLHQNMDDLKFRYRQCEFSLWSIDGETWACPLTSEALWNLPNMCQSRKGHNLKRPLLSLTSSVCCLWSTSIVLQLSGEWILCRKGCRQKASIYLNRKVSSVQFVATNILQNPNQNAQFQNTTNMPSFQLCGQHKQKVWACMSFRTMCQLKKTVFCSVNPPLFIYCVALTEEKRAGASKMP